MVPSIVWLRALVFYRRFRQTMLLMIGQPDYETYRTVATRRHPHCSPLSPIEFYADRERARFEGKKGQAKCC